MTALTGQGWKESFLGGNERAEAVIFQKYAEDIQLVQAENLKKSGGQAVRLAAGGTEEL